MSANRLVVGAVGGLGALVLAGGVAAAVTSSATLQPVALPAVCRDNPGSAGGALPGGTALQQSLSTLARSRVGFSGGLAKLAPDVGDGTAAEIRAREQALAAGAGTANSSAGTGASGSAGAAGSGGGLGTGSGTGSGSGGTGGLGGRLNGPGSGSGPDQVSGPGSDPSGVPQAPDPAISPPAITPPTPARPASSHHGGTTIIGLLVALIAAGIALGLYLWARNRNRGGSPELPDGTGMLPAQADAFAAEAMSQGDLDLALRWTFVSGLLRLDQVGVLPYDPARTTGDCSRWVLSHRFPQLAEGFDLVAYGGRHATRDDVLGARAGWDALIEEVRPRRQATIVQHGPLVAGHR